MYNKKYHSGVNTPIPTMQIAHTESEDLSPKKHKGEKNDHKTTTLNPNHPISNRL